MEGVSFAACGEANDLKLAPTTGGNAGPVLTGQLQPTAAMSPRIGGARAGEAPRPFFLPISSGRNGGARRVGASLGGSPR